MNKNKTLITAKISKKTLERFSPYGKVSYTKLINDTINKLAEKIENGDELLKARYIYNDYE